MPSPSPSDEKNGAASRAACLRARSRLEDPQPRSIGSHSHEGAAQEACDNDATGVGLSTSVGKAPNFISISLRDNTCATNLRDFPHL